MRSFVIRRVLLMVPTIIGTTIVVFLIMRVAPGDIATVLLVGDTGGSPDPVALAKLRHSLGTDRPLIIQYLSWVKGVPVGNFGTSMWNSKPISGEIFHRFPVTMQLALMGVFFGFLFGLPLGITSALKRGTWVDLLSRVTSIIFLAAPGFWLALVVIVVLRHAFDWLPPLGYNLLWQHPVTNMEQLIFPSLLIGIQFMAIIARMSRSTMLEVMNEDYIRTARAKGLSESVVIVRHALKNAMIPVFTIASLALGGLLAGTVVMESVFTIPGIGLFLLQSITNRDYTAVQGLVLLFSVVFVVINFLTDLTYGWLDPRISRH